MSADNWARCPRCSKQREERLAAMRAEAAEAYGGSCSKCALSMKFEHTVPVPA